MWRETFYIFIIKFSPQGREMLNIVVRKKPLVKKEMTMILRFIKKNWSSSSAVYFELQFEL